MAEGKNLVGVDIGASSIKVVQLKESRKKLQVIRWGWAPLPPQTIIDGHVMNAGAVTEALARIFHDGKIQQRDVAIGVYGQSVIVRKITVPMMTPGELDEQIHWEAEQHIPFDIKLMSIDYEVLRRRPEAGQMDLLLVAAKKDEINDYAAILREAKLRPIVVDINAFTIQNIFEHQYGLPADGTIALLNVGAAVSSLNIVAKGVSAFTREITNAGNSITEEIRKALSCSYEQAEAYKHGGGPTQIVPQEVTRSSTRRARRSPARSSGRSTSTSRRAASRRSAASTSRAGARTSRRSCRPSSGARACRCSSSTRWSTSRSTPSS